MAGHLVFDAYLRIERVRTLERFFGVTVAKGTLAITEPALKIAKSPIAILYLMILSSENHEL